MFNIEALRPESFTEWQYFVDAHPDGQAMSHVAWCGILRRSSSVTPGFLLARNAAGQVVGLLSTYFSRSLFTGPHATTLDHGLLTLESDVGEALIDRAYQQCFQDGGRYLLLRGVKSSGLHVDREHASVSTLINTLGIESDLWNSVRQKTRWYVRQGEKAGFTVYLDSELRHMELYYKLYARHVHRLGTPVISPMLMREMAHHLGPDRIRLLVVVRDGDIVGGMLIVRGTNIWLSMYAFVREDCLPLSANYVLYWEAIRQANREGATTLDLGRSIADSGVHRFKSKWGGIDQPLIYRYLAAPGKTLKGGLENYRTQKTIKQKIWTNLPLSVANTIGPILRKNLPFG